MTSLRIAFRSLLKTPGFTLIALLTLALGIGVNTSMYTLVDVLLFRSVPFEQPESMRSILGTNPQGQREGFSFEQLRQMREQTVGPDRAFAAITTYAYWNNTLADPDRPAERLLSVDATADFFPTYRVQPFMGRAYTAEEQVPGRNQVAILSHQVWQTRFGADPNIIGRSIRLNAEQVEVIGVMPASFVAPLFFGPVDLWRPMTVPQHIVQDDNNRFFQAIGRLNPNVTAEQAHAQLEPVITRWAEEHPQTSKDHGLRLVRPHESAMDETSRFIIWFMFAVGVIVLLIACANIANLQLARATANAKDLAIRSALGASRARLIVHQLTECMMLACGGGVAGVIVALWMNRLFGAAIRLGNSGETLELPVNATVLAVAFVATLFTGLAFGLLPAWFASRGNVVETLKQQTRGSTSGGAARFMRHALIVGQVACTLALLCGAGVMIRGLDQLLERGKGWDTDRVLFANIHLPEQSTYDTPEKRVAVTENLIRRLQQIPGAEATGICTSPPTFGFSKVNPVQVDGMTSDDPNQQPVAGFTMIASDYLKTIGLPLLQGREFPVDLKADHPGVVIINEAMARHFWPNDNALGKRIGERQGDQVNWREVIGIVPDIEFAVNIGAPPSLFQVYKPFVHEAWGYMHLVVRGQNPARFKNDVRQVVKDVDPDVAVQDMFTVAEAEDRFLHNLFTINRTIGGFALLGLVLAAVGLYGVISNLVAQRTAEFGIRLALGARPGNVLNLVLGTGVRLTVVGLLIGALLAAVVVYLLNNTMPQMAAFDAGTPAVIAVVLFAVAMFACWWPARRATKVDPLTALRTE